MIAAKTVGVDASELRDAVDFVSAGASFDNSAWICLETGKIYWRSSEGGLGDDELPADIEVSELYLAVPSQHDLDLGRPLALAFVAEELPDEYNAVVGFFRRRGAYSRLKSLLQMRGLLARWYAFETRATDEALRAWCTAHGIALLTERGESSLP